MAESQSLAPVSDEQVRIKINRLVESKRSFKKIPMPKISQCVEVYFAQILDQNPDLFV